MRRATFDETRPMGGQDIANQRPALTCHADGCSWLGSSGGDGHFFCVAHAASPDSALWPAITHRTGDLKWLADAIALFQQQINSQVPNADWVAVAADFWSGSDYPELAPTEKEKTYTGLYIYRLLGEARAMAAGTPRPPKHVPQGQQAGWKRRELSSEVIA
jgi:hypothetical protein